MFVKGQGAVGVRQAKRPEIVGVRELEFAELHSVPRAAPPSVVHLRDSHHMVARLFALGLKTGDIAARLGYSLNRVSMMHTDPAFQQLIACYREQVNEDFRAATDEYFGSVVSARVKTMRMINDRLDEADASGEQLPLNQLISIHSDAADRTGYPKRKESVNLNIDFADRLERARKRSATVIDQAPAAQPVPGPLAEAAQQEAADGAGRGAGTVSNPEIGRAHV